VSVFSAAAGQKTAGQNEKETVPFWRSFIRGFRINYLNSLTPET